MLRARKRTSTPYPSIVFTLGFVVESIKEFGGASIVASNENGHKSNKNLDVIIDATGAQLPKKVICAMIFVEMRPIG